VGRGFYTIMSAQFFSSLADNALFIAAIALLKQADAPEWHRAALVPMFAFFYVVLAPYVGAFADYLPKGKVMFFSNIIKVVGCLMMLFGVHPLIAYAIVGLGAAAYSPAKYGILTELLPPSQLVKANGWIEGLTIASIILGVVLGGQLIGDRIALQLLAFDLPMIDTGIDTPAEAAISAILGIYLIAAAFNLFIPRTGARLLPLPASVAETLRDFMACNRRLWNDKLGQISLASTTLFWGVAGNLRYIVLAWAAAALGYSTSQSTLLVGAVALGTGVGAVAASAWMKLDKATTVIPLGIGMGLAVIVMNFITTPLTAGLFLAVIGALGGFLVVPMNALLQHRGHCLMGAGRSIAVQNFNEQACILGLGALFVGMTSLGLNAFAAITIFGLIVAVTMWLIGRWHRRNCMQHKSEVDGLLATARAAD
jgi:MFS transporter, LPLT family, lysophospholipid transporter